MPLLNSTLPVANTCLENFYPQQPGAAFGIGNIIDWLSFHPTLTHVLILLFTFWELFVALGLFFGAMTRGFALGACSINIVLMVVFGWMGTTCIDEWNLSAYGFAMSLTLFLLGSGSLSVDHFLIQKFPFLEKQFFFKWLFSGRLHPELYKKLTLLLAGLTLVFTVGFYHYYRGAVVSKLYSRTALKTHSIAISNIKVASQLDFDAYIDGGPDTQGLYIMKVSLQNMNGKTLLTLSNKDFGKTAIKNRYIYLKIRKHLFPLKDQQVLKPT